MKKRMITIFSALFVLCLAVNASAITVTWTGGGADELASNPANWSGGIVPQNGDDVVFDGTSVKDCSWNLVVMLSSLKIKAEYTGDVTLTSDLTITNSITWTGDGADELASNPENWSSGAVPQNGDKIVFNDTTSKNCTWDISIEPDFVSLIGYSGTVTLNSALTINGSLTVTSGIFNLNDNDLTVDGYLLIITSGTLDATSSTITVRGSWSNWGSFIPGTSTVILAGSNQIIYGNTTFYDLIKTVTSADTLYFEAGSTQTIANSLTLQGADGELLALRSTEDGQPWYLDPQGPRNISFVDIKDLYNVNFVNIVVTNSVDSGGNNDSVSFGGSECVCSESGLILALLMGDHWRHAC